MIMSLNVRGFTQALHVCISNTLRFYCAKTIDENERYKDLSKSCLKSLDSSQQFFFLSSSVSLDNSKHHKGQKQRIRAFKEIQEHSLKVFSWNIFFDHFEWEDIYFGYTFLDITLCTFLVIFTALFISRQLRAELRTF